MKLPNAADAIIDEEKIRDYLLSRSHPIGRFKAVYFEALGFESVNWQELANAIRSLAEDADAERSDRNEFGQKFTVSGRIIGPNRSEALIVTVWIVLNSESIPRFITAYPGG